MTVISYNKLDGSVDVPKDDSNSPCLMIQFLRTIIHSNMRNFCLLNALLGMLVLFNSCGTTSHVLSMHDEYANLYVGRTYQDILLALGAPDRETSDGANGSVLIYEDEMTLTTTKATKENYNIHAGTYVPGSRSSSTTITSFLHLFINENKICYNLKTNHTKEVIEKRQSFKQIYARFPTRAARLRPAPGALPVRCPPSPRAPGEPPPPRPVPGEPLGAPSRGPVKREDNPSSPQRQSKLSRIQGSNEGYGKERRPDLGGP